LEHHPAQIASHFDAAGNLDRFTTRERFFGFEIETLPIVIGIGVLMQIAVLITPLEWINLKMPNREYRLTPEHCGEIIERMSSFAAFLFGTIQLGIQAGFEPAVSAHLHHPFKQNKNWKGILLSNFY
jgi:hypothetical protein